MQTYQLKLPQGVPMEVIKAALATLGDVTIRQVIPKASKAEKTFQEPVTVYRDGVAIDEINPIEVQKRIKKIMAEANRGKNSDGRSAKVYPEFGRGVIDNAQEYMLRFCSALNHKPTMYSNGVIA